MGIVHGNEKAVISVDSMTDEESNIVYDYSKGVSTYKKMGLATFCEVKSN